jgi:hypothetical protein
VAGRHLKLVMSKLESIYRAHATKKKTSALFFGLLRDRSGEEQQVVKKYFRSSFLWNRIRKELTPSTAPTPPRRRPARSSLACCATDLARNSR